MDKYFKNKTSVKIILRQFDRDYIEHKNKKEEKVDTIDYDHPIIKDKKGGTLLMKAFEFNHESLVKELIRKRVNPHLRDNNGETAVHYMFHGKQPSSKLLPHYKALEGDINIQDREGFTPLLTAIFKKYPIIVKQIINLFPDVEINKPNFNGETSLYIAVYHEHLSLVKLLLDKGADPDKRDLYDYDTIMLACEKGSLPLFKLLYYHNLPQSYIPSVSIRRIRILRQSSSTEWNALMLAVQAGMVNMVELVSDVCPDLDLTNDNDQSVWDIAKKTKKARTFENLFKEMHKTYYDLLKKDPRTLTQEKRDLQNILRYDQGLVYDTDTALFESPKVDQFDETKRSVVEEKLQKICVNEVDKSHNLEDYISFLFDEKRFECYVRKDLLKSFHNQTHIYEKHKNKINKTQPVFRLPYSERYLSSQAYYQVYHYPHKKYWKVVNPHESHITSEKKPFLIHEVEQV